jgi:steroid 5-alpha reductase family enzyme
VLQSDAFYDAVGSATTILTMLASFLHLARSEKCSLQGRTPKGHSCVVSVLSMALVLLWTVRLGLFLIYRIYKMGHDSRMDTIKVSAAKFLIAWTAQGVWVFSVTLPVTVLVSDVTAEGAGEIVKPLLALGMTMYVMGMMIAVPADWQKLQFRLKPENKVRTFFLFNR